MASRLVYDPATGKLIQVNEPQQNQRHAADPGDSLMFGPATGKLVVRPQQN